MKQRFERLKDGRMSVESESHSRRLFSGRNEKVLDKIGQKMLDRCSTVQEIATHVGIS